MGAMTPSLASWEQAWPCSRVSLSREIALAYLHHLYQLPDSEDLSQRFNTLSQVHVVAILRSAPGMNDRVRTYSCTMLRVYGQQLLTFTNVLFIVRHYRSM
jgi:hypothetical protein